jgi:hypothetical protein
MLRLKPDREEEATKARLVTLLPTNGKVMGTLKSQIAAISVPTPNSLRDTFANVSSTKDLVTGTNPSTSHESHPFG